MDEKCLRRRMERWMSVDEVEARGGGGAMAWSSAKIEKSFRHFVLWSVISQSLYVEMS